MPRPRKQSRIQADLINGDDGPGDGQTDGEDPGAPRIRLQDWEVIDEVSVGSSDYVILRRTKGTKSGVESLTPRERDAVRLACTGASNKHIAWAMGISDSTVGVLLLRARRKLKVVGRDELIRAFET
jgi:DNA-binding CsgD family transcriptional regulator